MNKTGKLYVIGMGPGGESTMSVRCAKLIREVEYIIGYKKYIQLLKDLDGIKGKCIEGVMKKEIDRCQDAIELAKRGNSVAIISSGDSGIYGMAGLILELLADQKSKLSVEIVPGITASTAASALLGAPIMHDSVSISLSNLLTDWELIEKRITYASMGDFVISLYNPRSKGRPNLINIAQKLMLEYKSPKTPVGIVRQAMREEESVIITTLDKMLEEEIDMFTTIIIGNQKTYVNGNKMITPRGYKIC